MRRIRLTESQLHRVILNTAKKLIREANYHPLNYSVAPPPFKSEGNEELDLNQKKIDDADFTFRHHFTKELDDEYQTQDTGDCMDSWQIDDLSSKLQQYYVKAEKAYREDDWETYDYYYSLVIQCQEALDAIYPDESNTYKNKKGYNDAADAKFIHDVNTYQYKI